VPRAVMRSSAVTAAGVGAPAIGLKSVSEEPVSNVRSFPNVLTWRLQTVEIKLRK